MINLMYLVLMAMLALNISTEVLNGFSIVEESLNRTTANSSKENEMLYADFADQMKANPQKVKEWCDKATAVKRMSDAQNIYLTAYFSYQVSNLTLMKLTGQLEKLTK